MSSKSDILEKVRNLLARAESTDFEAEADACRTKADQLMLKYAIEEYELTKEEAARFELRKVSISWYYEQDEIGKELLRLFNVTAGHCRVQVGRYDYSDRLNLRIGVMGMPADLDYFDMMFTSLMLQMSNTMLVKYDTSKSVGANFAAMKATGMNWEQIASRHRAATGEPFKRNPQNGKLSGWYIGQYKSHLRTSGEEQIKISPKVYKTSFAIGFVLKVGERMKAAQDEVETGGMGLVLRDMSQDLKEFAKAQGQVKTVGRRTIQINHGAIGHGQVAGSKVDLSGHGAKVSSGARKQLS